MDEVFKDPVQLSKGIKLKDLMTSGTEFQIDVNFKNKNAKILEDETELFHDFDEDDDSDLEEVLKSMEVSAEKAALSSPEYHTFEELASKMIDCMANGEVKMLILEEGDGPLIPCDAEVSFHYAAYWEQQRDCFDTTLDRNGGEPMRVRLGQGAILPGLEAGLTLARGPRARLLLLVQPAWAWGRRGAPPRIPPLPVLFAVATYAVRDVAAASRFNSLPKEEQTKFEVTIKTVTSIHDDAKKLFSKHKYEKSTKNYQQAISVLRLSQPATEPERNEIKKLLIKSYVNLMLCYFKLNKPKYIFGMYDNLDNIIDVSQHCKAVFYKGRAYELQGDIDKAIINYKKALKLEPKNKDIGKVLSDLNVKLEKASKNEKDMWRKSFKNDVVDEKYDVDDDFESCAKDMIDNLMNDEDYAKYNMPLGLNDDEVKCVKVLANRFKNICVVEDGEGRKKKVTLIKKKLY